MAAAILLLLASMILGLVGRKGLGHQLGRNEAWNHFGNFSTAALSGAIGYFYGIPGVFAVMLAMGLFSVVFIRIIDPGLIDYDTARGLEKDSDTEPASISALFSNRPVLIVGLTMFLFHLGNAALLPLLGQSAVAAFGVNPAVYTAATVVIAQVTMVPMALWVATPGIVAKILRGSGHINMGLGLVMTLQGIGAASSTSLAGIFAHYAGYDAAFMVLTVCACCAVVLFLSARKWMMPFRRILAE